MSHPVPPLTSPDQVFDYLAETESFQEFRERFQGFQKPGFVVQVLFPQTDPGPLAAAVWRGSVQALQRFPLRLGAELSLALLWADFLGGLRQVGSIPDAEWKQARTDLVHAQILHSGEVGWLAGLVLTSLYDPGLPQYVGSGLLWTSPLLRPHTLTWMTSIWTAQGTWNAIQKKNREFLYDRLTRHAEETYHFIPQSAFMDAYWTLDPRKYAGVRRAFVRWADSRNLVSHTKLEPKPKSHPSEMKIGIVASNWREQHASRKALLTSVQALRAWGAQVYLVDTHPDPQICYSDFDGSISVHLAATPQGTVVEDSELAAAGLDFLYFIETYQAELDTLLALRRYAPIQATGYGIPVSTQSPNMDYFFTGSSVECRRGLRDYSEKPLMLPGIGMHSALRETAESFPKDPGQVRVVVSANLVKFTPEYLDALGRIARAVPGLDWVFLPNNFHPYSLAAVREVQNRFGDEKVSWYLHTKKIYLPLLQSADLILDAVPYSGYTTVVDAISLGTPILTWKGTHGQERLGAAVAQTGGMPGWLLSTSLTGFEQRAIQLLRSPLLRFLCRKRIARHRDRLFDERQALVFADTVKKLLLKA